MGLLKAHSEHSHIAKYREKFKHDGKMPQFSLHAAVCIAYLIYIYKRTGLLRWPDIPYGLRMNKYRLHSLSISLPIVL